MLKNPEFRIPMDGTYEVSVNMEEKVILFSKKEKPPKQKQLYEYANDHHGAWVYDKNRFDNNLQYMTFGACCSILKLVCEDNGMKFSEFMWRCGTINGCIVCNISEQFNEVSESVEKIISICGQEFLQRIFEK